MRRSLGLRLKVIFHHKQKQQRGNIASDILRFHDDELTGHDIAIDQILSTISVKYVIIFFINTNILTVQVRFTCFMIIIVTYYGYNT
jgi:hypothetical protein